MINTNSICHHYQRCFILVCLLTSNILTYSFYPNAASTFTSDYKCPTNQTGCGDGRVGEIFTELQFRIEEDRCDIAKYNTYPSDYSPNLREGDIFDFIIVGSGAAGSVVANRLSEVGKFKVLLLEAGHYPPYSSEMIHLSPYYQSSGENIDWNYKTERTGKTCLGFIDDHCTWPRGKVLGGSTTTNSMLYVRGQKYDFNHWAELTKDETWNFDHVFPYFLKSEDLKEPEGLEGNPEIWEYHGKDGYQGVGEFFTNAEYYERTIDVIFSAFQKVGVPIIADINNPKTPVGVTKLKGMIRNGLRCSTANGFLKSVGNRKNLKIALNSLVTKVIVDEKSLTATGVEVKKKDGTLVKVKASKEVILSGGSINSPQILMLSGIGATDHLSKFGIKVLKELPGVGYNLHDHPLFSGFLIAVDRKTPTTDQFEQICKFLNLRTGRLAGVDLNCISAFVNVKNITNNLPNSQLTLNDYNYKNFAKIDYLTRSYKAEIRDSIKKYNEQSNLLQITPTVARPESRGYILLNSSNPEVAPIINPNYLSSDSDRSVMLSAINFLVNIVESEVVKTGTGAEIIKLNIAGCNQFKFKSMEYWNCAIDHLTTTSYHPAGTCKMGSLDDKAAVVDSKLKVIGIKNLRVIDASIMPLVVSNNPAAATIMIGEKGADLVKRDWLEDGENFNRIL